MMLPQIDDIVYMWNTQGIIIETQFQFAYQRMFKTSHPTAYEIIVEHGGYALENDEDDYGDPRIPLCIATEVSGEGWMYAFFDPDRISISRAETLIKRYFIRS